MASTARPTFSVVVPIYNEEPIIEALHARLCAVLDASGRSWNVYYVDDGSRDRSLELLLTKQRQRPDQVRVVELSRNWGHQSALTAGLATADGDAVILMDGDLQDPPEEIPKLTSAWDRGAEVVIAVRTSRAERGLRGALFPLFYRILGFLSDFPIPLNAGVFGLLDRRAVDVISALTETNRYLPGLRSWIGFRTECVYYDRGSRHAGEPKMSLWKLVKYGLDAIFSFTYKPLRLGLFIGLATSAFALLYGAVLLYCRIAGIGMFGAPVVAGYTSTIVSVLLLGGVQLISVGVLGEYIGRIYDEVKRRPLYLIRKVHQKESAP